METLSLSETPQHAIGGRHRTAVLHVRFVVSGGVDLGLGCSGELAGSGVRTEFRWTVKSGGGWEIRLPLKLNS
jgi:hypothetical protein